MSDFETVYFAGELFDLKHLAGNAMLADAIHRKSAGRFRCALPQNLEPRDKTAAGIRNADIKGVIASDCCLFNFDGTDADSGTVVEFSIAKFLDIPSVIIRSDIRNSGDTAEMPWNLMMGSFPRTESVVIPSLVQYQEQLGKLIKERDSGSDSIQIGALSMESSKLISEDFAEQIVAALEAACSKSPCLDAAEYEQALRLMQKTVGAGFEKELPPEFISQLVNRRFH